MRCPDSVDIELLADSEIPLNFRRSHAVSVLRIGVMVVHALELDLMAVEQVQVSPDLNVFESDALPDAAVGAFDVQVVEHRVLGAPLHYRKIVERNLRLSV